MIVAILQGTIERIELQKWRQNEIFFIFNFFSIVYDVKTLNVDRIKILLSLLLLFTNDSTSVWEGPKMSYGSDLYYSNFDKL